MAFNDTCLICGDDTNGYLFCRSCYYKYRNRKILLSIENCEDIELIDEDMDEYDENDQNDESECLICGEDSDGYLFCKSCYRKYRNKSLLLSVKNCEDFEVINESDLSILTGNAFEDAKDIRTEDGHMVRSKQELLIDNMLYAAGISHAYEKPLPYTKTNGDLIIPDWFIPVLKTTKGIYIEYWGIKNKKSYDINRAEKEKIYRQENIPVIHIEADETSNMQQLEQKLIVQLNELAQRYFKIQHFIE